MADDRGGAPVQAVLFDLGGVLIDWNPRYLYRAHLADEAAVEDFLAQVCPPDWNHGMDAGRPVAEAVAERQALYPQHAALIARWRDDWPQMLGGAIAPTVEVLERLHGLGVPLFALTNWSAETFPVARARYAFLARFRDIVVSGEEKCAKPDPAIFAVAARRSGVPPTRTLFIDDSAVNIEAARSAGFLVHHFSGAPGLTAALQALQLL